MPKTVADFAEKGKSDPFYTELAHFCSANNGLLYKVGEDDVLASAPKVVICEL